MVFTRYMYYSPTSIIRTPLAKVKFQTVRISKNVDHAHDFDRAYKNVYTIDLSSFSMILISFSINRTLILRFFYFLER
jgi:hypothetical protein